MQLETKVAVVMLLSQFDIRIDASKLDWKVPEDIVQDTKALITLSHGKGVWLQARLRVPPAQDAT